MYSEAQNRAAKKYRSLNTFKVQVEFNKKYDQEIIDYLNTKESKATFIKQLIRDAMEKEKKN